MESATLTQPGAAVADAPTGSKPWHRAKRKRRPSVALIDGLLVFLAFGTTYLLIGHEVVTQLHVVNFDSLSRLAHAYFVWYNDPAKLAAIGFVWPPVQTLTYLPFALASPLATSLNAIPASSATFMAGTMVMIAHALRVGGMRWFARWPLLLAFGLNPMILYYGANGMAEAVYLFFLSFAVYFLIRWGQTRQHHLIAFVGFGSALAMLSRYEIAPYAVVLAVGITFVTLTTGERSDRARSVESGLVLYLAPVVYFGVAWLFFNWLILGDPLYFLSFGATTADLATSQQDVGGLEARELGPSALASYLILLNLALFPLTVIVAPALIITGFFKRSSMSIVIAALLATNALVTALLFLRTVDPNLVQLRYNMRAMPIAMMGVAWLYWVWKTRAARTVIWIAALVILVGSLPMTWRTMETYTYQYEENVFLRALETGEDQEGNTGIGGYPIGIAGEVEMADFINANVPPEDVIFTDDAQSLGVMLLSGHPDRFYDRIDKGDGRWFERRDDPWGHVDYFLVATNERCRPPCTDLVRDRYTGILQNEFPGLEVVFATDRYALISVAPEEPRRLREDARDSAASASGGTG